MVASKVPKYQAIHGVLRRRILGGELAPGERLPPQQELADSFGVTLMTLRQAVAALEADGLVRAERGRGTFVAERPVDIAVGNLSSFSEEMTSAGVDLLTEVLSVLGGAADDWPAAAAALDLDRDLVCVTRLRSVSGAPLALQRSYLDPAIVGADDAAILGRASLYETIEERTGRVVAEARESITAVALGPDDAVVLAAEPGDPALLSIRTSIDQFGRPFLYDEAWLVGGRCTIAAHRSSTRLALHYGHTPG